MPDATADEPDTSEIPVLPNSVYAPVRDSRVRWRSDVLEHPAPQTALLVVSSQNVPAATSSWSAPLPVTHETPPAQPPVTPHIDVQPEIPPPTSSTDDHPMPPPHDVDTSPSVYQESETPWVYRTGYTSDYSKASAVATHTGFSVTGGVEHVHW